MVFFAHDKGNDGVGSIHDEDQSVCFASVVVLGAEVEGLSCFFCTFQQMWISRATTMDLARPSSIGSAFEHIMLTFRISEQQCCLEFDSASKFHRVPKW